MSPKLNQLKIHVYWSANEKLTKQKGTEKVDFFLKANEHKSDVFKALRNISDQLYFLLESRRAC